MKSLAKTNQSEIKNLDAELKDERTKVSQLSVKNQEKEKKITEK